MMKVTEHINNIRFVQGWLKFTTYFAPILVIVLTTLVVINSLSNYFASLFWMPCAFFMLIAVLIASIKLYKFKYATQFSDEGITLSDKIFMYNAIKCNDIIRAC